MAKVKAASKKAKASSSSTKPSREKRAALRDIANGREVSNRVQYQNRQHPL